MNSAQALAAAAQRELDALRAELDLRLAALEHALAHPDPGMSLERLVLDLARVATAEAESAAARATLEAQLQAQEQGAAAAAVAQAALEAARARAAALQAELEQTRAALAQEKGSAAQVRRELELGRTEIQAAIDADAAQRRQIDELEQAATRRQQELADARRASDTRAAGEERQRAAIATLERRCAELEDACSVAATQASAAVTERERVAATLEELTRELEAERQRGVGARAAAAARLTELEAERRRHAEMLADAAARMAQSEAGRGEVEQGRQEAEAQADELSADRDELRLMLDAAKKTIQGMNAAVDERLAAIDAKRARALQAAEERAAAAVRERDALAGECDVLAAALAAVPPAGAGDGGDAMQRLDAATARIHVLELQLFERDRGPRDLDVDLESLLPQTPPQLIVRAGAPATRHGFKPPKKVRIDREGGLLVDLSVSGAQVICATAPEVGRVVTLTLLSDESPCFCQGRLLWARREQTAKGRPYRYPAGIAFTAVDDAAIRAFIARHAPDQT